MRLPGTGVSTGGRAHSSHVGQFFICFSQERALNVKVKHGAQLHAQHTRDVHGSSRSVYSRQLFAQVFFKLIDLIGRWC